MKIKQKLLLSIFLFGVTFLLCAEDKSFFEGVWGCNYGMSRNEVEEIISQKTGISKTQLRGRGLTYSSEICDQEGLLQQSGLISGFAIYAEHWNQRGLLTYAGMIVDGITFSFINDQLTCIHVQSKDNKDKINTGLQKLIDKYSFSLIDSDGGKRKYKSGNIEFYYNNGWGNGFTFLNTYVKDWYIKKVKEIRKDDF